jgi:hypothetical protein
VRASDGGVSEEWNWTTTTNKNRARGSGASALTCARCRRHCGVAPSRRRLYSDCDRIVGGRNLLSFARGRVAPRRPLVARRVQRVVKRRQKRQDASSCRPDRS